MIKYKDLEKKFGKLAKDVQEEAGSYRKALTALEEGYKVTNIRWVGRVGIKEYLIMRDTPGKPRRLDHVTQHGDETTRCDVWYDTTGTLELQDAWIILEKEVEND